MADETPTPRNPLAVIALDRAGNGTFEIVDFPQQWLERHIVVDGQRYAHCADELDGVWRYRLETF